MNPVLKAAMLSLLDEGTKNAKTLIGSLNDTIEKINVSEQLENLNAAKEALTKKAISLFGDINDFVKQVNESVNDFEYTLPFDGKAGEKVESWVKDDDVLCIHITFSDEHVTKSHKTEVKLPANSDTEHITYNVNDAAKTITFLVPKLITPSVNEPNATPESESVPSDEETKHDEPKEEEIPSREPNEDEIDKIIDEKTSKGTKTVRKTSPRASNGRFVKRVPSAN